MACHPNENVYTQTFTPREYQVELLDSAKVGNTIICCNTSLTKTFVAVKLVQEFNRKCPNYMNSLRTLFLFDELNMSVMAHQLKLLTNISCSILHSDVTTKEWQTLLDNNSVILTTAELLDTMIIRLDLNLSIFRLIVVDDCLYGARQIRLHNLMRVYSELPFDNRPRILGLVSGLLSADMKPVYLESEMRRLEKLLCSRVDTSSELVTLIRHSCRPREYIVECDRHIPSDLSIQMRKIAENAREFLADHQYDLSNIYGDFMDEVKMVPDPTTTPLELLDQFLDILGDLGPWGGDQGALKILEVIEKLKVKVPFERHFILLRMMTTVMVTIRAHCDIVFDGMEEIDKIMNYSSPKIIRFIDIVGEFRPVDCAKPPVVPDKPIVQETMKSNPKGKKSFRGFRKSTMRPQNDDSLCALVFVENRFTAKVLFTLLWALSRNHNDYWWISAQYVLNKMTDPAKDPKEAELEHSNQEESLRKFRAHDCNIMIATSVLEQGCDLPRCNLVVRFDLPRTYHSYVQCKARARSTDAHHLLLADTGQLEPFVRLHLAQYTVVESRLLQRCHSLEPSEAERHVADTYGATCEPYKTRDDPDASSVTLASAISLVNRYCAKLPSDTFTRLTPLWKMEQTSESYICQLRLPINSPVKQTVVSPPMPNQLLARRVAAFFTCQLLHKAGEVDDNLLPIGKENFRAIEEGTDYNLDEDDELLAKENLVEQRPGTTKRRQYYYKCIAEPLTKCHPQLEQEVYFYKIKMTLTCPLPEEQNTRGRKIYPPEESPQGFGILTAIKLPLVCEFPIFTRSGEVSVTFELCDSIKNLTSEQIVLIKHFVNYTFDNVLRLQKYLMLFDPSSAPSAYMIVPTFTTDTETKIDWDFMNIIYGSKGRRPNLIPDTERRKFHFDSAQYRDAVVMPWYRNQDQPQYFYVAEICTHLTPDAAFPGSEYATFAEYYLRKYQIEIQNTAQHLLDVDHTSARLNFLTPRYVNRKGVALPTSSEETKRAKRENLEQKQILIPELCDIHPFPASLWRKAVCLPCILYRMNALLLADQVRKIVAVDMGLGTIELKKDFIWSPLNFGWNLSDVLQKFKSQENGGENDSTAKEVSEISDQQLVPRKKLSKKTELSSDDSDEELNKISKKHDGELIEIGTWSNEMVSDTSEIGTWSNEMASEQPDLSMVRYASPTSWLKPANYYDDFDSDVDDDISTDGEGDVTLEDSDDSDANLTGEKTAGGGGLHIKFREDHVAEAVDNYDNSLSSGGSGHDHLLRQQYTWDQDEYYDSAIEANEGDDGGGKVVQSDSELVREFRAACEESAKKIETNGLLIRKESKFARESISAKLVNVEPLPNLTTPSELVCPPLNKRITPAVVASYSKQNGIKSDEATTPVDTKDSVDIIPFSFDRQPDLNEHPGPSPSIILQALTMSNANDGINLERLETIGDSFLKYAITDYLYSKYETVHEGKLSHLRSKQVSNLNLYRLGKRKALGGKMIATKFDPHDNWLPPCYFVPKEVQDHRVVFNTPENWEQFNTNAVKFLTDEQLRSLPADDVAIKTGPTVPYNLVTQHSIPDKSIADCVEALIGSYLIECGPRGALLFMAWLGIKVLPLKEDNTYGELPMPNSPLLRNIDNPELELDILLDGYSEFEGNINYTFNDRAYLLQALTHASYSTNRLTDCYQRLEFLGDAVLDYLITRHLYEDARMHSPGALTDLRSALVNNTIFASLAVRHGFHRYFKHLSPGLYEVVEKFIRQQEQSGHGLVDELYLMADSECKEVEDVEVPKSLGDIFESVAGAIFLDSGRSLDAVWRVYYRMMCKEIEQFSDRVPKSPIRELLELEPETAKFGTPEKLADGRRVRVTVEVFGKGVFKGIGRNYRIAKCTAAKCALKYLRKQSGGGSSRRTCN